MLSIDGNRFAILPLLLGQLLTNDLIQQIPVYNYHNSAFVYIMSNYLPAMSTWSRDFYCFASVESLIRSIDIK